jgi:hypothetical protein
MRHSVRWFLLVLLVVAAGILGTKPAQACETCEWYFVCEGTTDCHFEERCKETTPPAGGFVECEVDWYTGVCETDVWCHWT